MCITVFCFSLSQRYTPDRPDQVGPAALLDTVVLFCKWANRLSSGLLWLDAKIMPRSLATVLHVRQQKDKNPMPVSRYASQMLHWASISGWQRYLLCTVEKAMSI